MDDIDQLQKYLEALTSALEQNLRAKGMDLSYGGMYMRSVIEAAATISWSSSTAPWRTPTLPIAS